jgi:hypothetical protein
MIKFGLSYTCSTIITEKELFPSLKTSNANLIFKVLYICDTKKNEENGRRKFNYEKFKRVFNAIRVKLSGFWKFW